MYQMLQYVAVWGIHKTAWQSHGHCLLWLRQDKLTFILIDKSDGTSFAGDVNIFFGQAQPYNRNEHRTSMLNRGSPVECESNMSRLVMYWQCKQGWGLWEWDQARYADMVTGCYWENSVSRQPMVPVCSQMIQQISTSSGRLRPSRRHRRSEDGFCRASMKWELVWLVVFSPVSSWFLYVCFLMFFYHGFFICYRLFLNLSNFCAIHSRWWWQISNAVARESLERQCNLCRPGRESVDSQSESLTKKEGTCPTYVQH